MALRGDVRSQRKKHILGQGQKVDLGQVWSSVDGRETHGESAAEAKGWWGSWKHRWRAWGRGSGNTEGGQWGWHLQQQLNNIHVYQPQDRLPIDVGDEVSSTQACLLGRAPILHVLGGEVGGQRSGQGPRGNNPIKLLPLTLPQFP